MSKPNVKDNLNFICHKNYKKVLQPGETLYWSGELLKINKVGKRQVRQFLITSDRFINLGHSNEYIMNLFTKYIKRSIKIALIEAITYSTLSNNFVLHVPAEYDYHLCSADRDDVLIYILALRALNGLRPLKFFFLEEIDLTSYSRLDTDKADKWPEEEPSMMDQERFEEFKEDRAEKVRDSCAKTTVIFHNSDSKVNQESFELLKTLGKGYSGQVFLAKKKDTNKLFALKVISKLDVIKRNFFDNVKNEREILASVDSPFLVGLEFCFASPSNLFFALPFRQGGELYHHLRKASRFSEETAKFYAAQVLLGLIHLHSKGILYRDLKPENVLLDAKGNAGLADFGISKILGRGKNTQSFIGTPAYVAPEIVLQKGHSMVVDVWCFGVLLFEMVYGLPPFHSKNQNLMLHSIVKDELSFPEIVKVSENFKDFVGKVG